MTFMYFQSQASNYSWETKFLLLEICIFFTLKYHEICTVCYEKEIQM